MKFLARGSGFSLFLTATEAVLSLQRSRIAIDKMPSSSDLLPDGTKSVASARAVLTIRMAGANPAAEVTGQALLFGTSNYFIGNDPNRWMTNVPIHGRVCYRDIYPGVDLIYYGVQRQLEYDFMVAPGVDPSLITLDFEGVNNLSVTPAGDLFIKTASDEIRQRKPFIYQQIEGGKHEVGGCYVWAGGQRVSFEVGAYDPSQPLIIDPVLAYSTYLGGTGTGFDAGNGIAVDGDGNAYITGRADSIDFPTTPGALQGEYSKPGNTDAFVAKLNSAGSALVYSTYLGGVSFDEGRGITVDHEGNTYVTGQTMSANFPTTPDMLLAGHPDSGNADVFVTKLNPAGSALIYSTYLGGVSFDEGRGIAADHEGSVYITGETTSRNFPTTSDAFQAGDPDPRSTDAFVMRFRNMAVPAAGSVTTADPLPGSTDR